ncbi:MAG TPA: type II toxin-antitoxin system RelE/ParE family toxin [Candidatus Nanoarchaeia archaeon]|nr:type II toxin-antitoxin system RelE/ParE family toxin [Candidatus Nanoarchaeia archaeon]
MVKLDYDPNFSKIFSKLDSNYKERLMKLIVKIINNPEIGKPMRNVRKGTKELYLKPFRLSYTYLKQEDKIILLDFYHKKKQ